MEFAILGPLEVRDDGRGLALGGPKQRAVLAMLLLDANRPLSRDRLIDGLWGESPPPSAAHTLDDYVSRLRRALGGARIERQAAGYLIRVEPGELDLERFEALLEQGRRAAAAGHAARASAVLGEALELWRGRALADLENEPFAASESERLEERRLLAVEVRIDAELELGRGGELVGELERLVAEHPFRERLLGQLMVSLYRAGRQTDALAAYQAGRRRLAAELGLEPSPELQALERRILAHDAALTPPTKTRRAAVPRRLGRRSLAVAALALAAVGAGVAAGVELGTGTTSASNASAAFTGLSEFDSHVSRVIGRTPRSDWPAALAADQSSLWLAEPNASEVVRVDRSTRREIETIPVSGTPALLAIGGGAAWVASASGGRLTRIDTATYRTTTVELGGAHAAALAYGFGRLWVADPTDAELLAIDPTSGQAVRRLQVDVHPTALAVGAGALWIADYDAGSVTRLDPRSGTQIFTVSVGHGPAALAVGDDGAIWVANSLDQTVSRIDPALGRIVATIPVGDEPVALAARDNSVLVANEYSMSVSRIDARRTVVATSAVPGGPTALVAAGGRVWVGSRALDEHRGGTLVLQHTRPLSLDPAAQVDLPPPQSNGLTYDALLTYTAVGGTEQLVPDLAENVPTPTDDGTTYIFRLRQQPIYYSSGQPVRASDFRYAIERIFRVRSSWSGNYRNIVGASACTAKRCDLAHGVVTDDAARTITFHLDAPDRSFLSSMTSMATAPVPPGTPFHEVATAIPGTGPYMVASANKHEIRYVRNPRFREWSHAAQPDGNPNVIVMRYGLTPAQEARQVEEGKADWTADGIPAALQREVMTRYPAQLHYLPLAETDFFRLNTTRPPFNDLRVRKALNLAIDRAALVRMWGAAVATPTCQVLPPSFLGYRRYCPYTRDPRPDGRWTEPDLARARRLVAASGTQGEQITVWGAGDGPVHETTVVPYTVGVLRRLGYHAHARLVPSNYWDQHPRVFKTMQLIEGGWANGTTFEFINNAFACAAPANTHFFCDHRLDRAIRQTSALEARNPRAASVLWARIDRELVDQAAWVPLVNIRWVDFVSSRVHNYERDPVVGLIADQVSLQ